MFIIFVICLIKSNKPITTDKSKIINKLVRGVSRWSNASQQDKSPLIAVLHSNYAAGYLWALQDIALDKEIESASGVDMSVLIDKVTTYQDQAHKKMVGVCPSYASHLDEYLSKFGGES